jgi:hypothetical protein
VRSLRDHWFKELAARGIIPWRHDIREPFRSSAPRSANPDE